MLDVFLNDLLLGFKARLDNETFEWRVNCHYLDFYADVLICATGISRFQLHRIFTECNVSQCVSVADLRTTDGPFQQMWLRVVPINNGGIAVNKATWGVPSFAEQPSFFQS